MEKEKLKIGIDLDEVLVHTAPAIIDFVNKKEGTTFKVEDAKEFELWKLFSCSQEEGIKKVYDFFSSDFFLDLMPLENSVESINFLYDVFDLIVITSRDDKIKIQTLDFIDKYFNNQFKEIFFTNQFSGEGVVKTKAQICKELGIGILIEDRRKYAIECAEKGIKVFLMDKPWNSNCEHENIIRVKNWNEIMEKLNQEVEN